MIKPARYRSPAFWHPTRTNGSGVGVAEGRTVFVFVLFVVRNREQMLPFQANQYTVATLDCQPHNWKHSCNYSSDKSSAHHGNFLESYTPPYIRNLKIYCASAPRIYTAKLIINKVTIQKPARYRSPAYFG